MRRLSGEFLARLMHAVESCNMAETTPEVVAHRLTSALQASNLYVDVPEAEITDAEPVGDVRRRVLPPGALDRLNALLPWCSVSGARSGAGLASQGSMWSARKATDRVIAPGQAVRNVARAMSLAGKSVLDIGCFEGNHAIGFAQQGASVWAVDGRIENVVKTLVRVWLAGVDHLVRVQYVDLEVMSLSRQLRALGRDAPFDLVHHNAVLNHLSDPVAHLQQCAEVCAGMLYLNTHVESCSDDEAGACLTLGGESYAVRAHGETRTPYLPFGGMTATSHWLTRDSLMRLLGHLGFGDVQIQGQRSGPKGARLALTVRKGAAHDRANRTPTGPRAMPGLEGPATTGAAHANEFPAKFKRVLVVGLGRSGTSALGSLLHQCGFFMGEDLDPVLHESPRLQGLLRSGQVAELHATLAAWCSGHAHVAWKDPKLHSAGRHFIDELPADWLVIAVFRDPVAIAQRRAMSDSITFDEAFAHTVRHEARLREFVLGTRKRVLPVSYERLRVTPLAVITEVLSHLDLEGLPPRPVEDIWAGMQERHDAYRQAQGPDAAPASPAAR